jgi:tRNA A-37 threonylcarbamoyl transferase component Bud32
MVLEPGARFCPNDGTRLSETAAVSTVPTPTGERPPAIQLQLPVLIGGRYRLEELRGGGGMAKVYRATDTTLERPVAVKLINPELRTDPEFDTRFQREARIAGTLADPHIVVVHDFGIDAALGPFLVMEYLQGQSLRERLQNEGPLPLKAGLQLSAQLLLALIHAHGRNIVHRDIKPDNIFLLNQSGVRLHVRVLDFGIARIMRGDQPAKGEALTSPGAVLGTPRYMSPEQLGGQAVDTRSDLYSAALVIFEAITGKMPYVGGERLCQLCPEASPALQELLEQCLRPTPADRPASAVEVYLRLQELGKASGVLLLPPGALDRMLTERRQSGEVPAATTIPYRPARPRWLRQSLVAAGVFAVLAGCALLLWKALSGGTGGPPAASETLLGVKIGDAQQDVVDRLRLSKGGVINPWAGPRPEYLAHLLQKEDLQVSDADLGRLDVQRTADERVCVVFLDGKVRAMIVREPHTAVTGRGLKMHASANDLDRLYPETPSARPSVKLPPSEDPTGKDHLKVERYDELGIAFEVHKAQVVAITLFPRTGP